LLTCSQQLKVPSVTVPQQATVTHSASDAGRLTWCNRTKTVQNTHIQN